MTAATRLAALLLAAAAQASPPEPRAGTPSRDAGRAPAAAPGAGADLSAEDREVVENLELLEALEEAGDLDLLLDLAEAE